MRMEVLALILTVAECGSISAAARTAHIQQTSLSAAIKSVEKELNIKIFARQHDGVVLTHEGKELVKIAQPMLGLYRSLLTISQPTDQTLRISVNRLMYCYFCYDVLPLLHMHYPGVSVMVSIADEDSILDATLSPTQLGIGCCRLPQLEAYQQQAEALDLTLTPLLTSELMMYVHKDNPLSAMGSVSDVTILRGQRIIIDAYCEELFYLAELDKISKSFLFMNRFDPMQLINAVMQGDAVAFAVDKRIIPSQFYSSMKDIVPLTIVEPQGNQIRHIIHYLLCRKKRQLSPDARAVADYITPLLNF